MPHVNTERLKKMLIRHEDLRLKPYKCTSNKLTIGVGRNLDDKGISKDEALYMLNNDIFETSRQLHKYSWYVKLNSYRKEAIIDMAINLGIAGLLKFKKMIKALEEENFDKAAYEALDSRWADQVGNRAFELAFIIREGYYDEF